MVSYAAKTGFMPEYGIHLTEKKKGDMLFIFDQDFKNELKDIGQIIPLTVGLMINVIAPMQVVSVLVKVVKTLSFVLLGVLCFLVVLTQYKLLTVFGLKAFLGMFIMFAITALIPWWFGGQIKAKQKALLCNSTLRNGAAAMVVVSSAFPPGPSLASALTDTLFRFIFNGSNCIHVW